MASVVILPKFKAWVPVTGVPAASYCLRTYAAGTTTNQAVYTDAACTIAAANPVVLDSNGEAILYAVAGTLYKFSLYDPTNTVQQSGWPVDNVTIAGGTGGGGGGGGGSSGEWVASGLVPAFISTTSFAFPVAAGNVTSTYALGRRLQTTNTGGTIYSTIVSSVFTTFTTITVVNDSGVLDSGLSVVNYGALNSVNRSIPFGSFIGVEAGTQGNLTTATRQTQLVTSPVVFIDKFSEFSAGIVTIKQAGNYLVTASASLNLSGVTFSGSLNYLVIQQNSADTFGQANFPLETFAGVNTGTTSAVMPLICNVNDTIRVQVQAAFSAGTVSVASCLLTVLRVGPN